jgi:hypothetical protein
MKSYYTFFCLIFGILSPKTVFAQSFQSMEKTHSDFYSTAEVRANQGQLLDIQLNKPLTSISIELSANQSFESMTLFAEGEGFKISKEIHSELNLSNLIVFSQPITQFQLMANNTDTSLKLHLINVIPLSKTQKIWEDIPHRAENECEKPPIITGAQWRTGLPLPKESPVATSVRHVIIHHAAGSNTATNFVEVVRNIYVFHTESNGWNDIGYHYLIAQDGTIFEGRLGQVGLESDNVLGAHFCGKNAGTMGICLLGDYQTTVNPTQATLNALYKLVAWKLKKENLFNPLALFMHPQGASDAKMLGVISGHRDGCATDCPGNNVYRQLAQIRTQVSAVCTVLAEKDNLFNNKLQIYPQPATDEVFIDAPHTIEQISVGDLVGKEVLNVVFSMQQTKQKLNLKNLKSGVYILSIAQKGNVVLRKLVVE